MFIKIFIILSLAYYILRFFKPDFYVEMILKGFLDRNKECKSVKEFQESLDETNRGKLKDACVICLLSLFGVIHMMLEVAVVVILIFQYKNITTFIYLIFWMGVYIKRRIDNHKNRKVHIYELDIMRANINKCFKFSERAIVLVDMLFFGYTLFNIAGGMI